MNLIKIRLIFLILLLFLLQILTFAQELTPEQLFDEIDNCVVVLLSYDFDGKFSKQGSGVVINDKGWVVTNYHVFAECENIKIKHKDKTINYTGIVGANVKKDILILKINENVFSSISLGNSDLLKVGQRIYAIGSPLGLENSISEGIISGFRKLDVTNNDYIQITASISPGSSGGAVVNCAAELIGISTMTKVGGQNLNFAIPINDVIDVAENSSKDLKQIEAANYFFKGFNALEKGEYYDAIIYYSKYLEIFPYTKVVYYNRGLAYYNSGNKNTACEDWQKSYLLGDDDAKKMMDKYCK